MRKNRIYVLKLVLKSEELDIVLAECGYPAGMGPKGSWKHIAAVPYSLVHFSHHGSLPEYRTSTQMLQQWHVDIVPVDELGPHQRQLTSSIRSYGSGVVFDRCPTSLRKGLSKIWLNHTFSDSSRAFTIARELQHDDSTSDKCLHKEIIVGTAKLIDTYLSAWIKSVKFFSGSCWLLNMTNYFPNLF